MDQYVIIVVPPKNIIEKVDEYRKKYAKHTNYSIVPHFTVYPPFYIPRWDEKEIVEILKKGIKGVETKTVRFEKIGYFEGKNKVVFFEPDEESSEYLKNILIKITKALDTRVKNVYDDYNFSPEKFKPHMTIAERIPDNLFEVVKKELGELREEGEFIVSSVFVYKHQPEVSRWENLDEINFY